MFVEAAKEDVPEIIALRHQIWGTTYRGIYPDDMIDNFDWAWHQEKELLRINDPAYSVYLLQKDDQNIGYLTMSQNRRRSSCSRCIFIADLSAAGDRSGGI